MRAPDGAEAPPPEAVVVPLQRYRRLDQMMFSWEKQKTPSRPPLMEVSTTTPESATMVFPSNSFTLKAERRRLHDPSPSSWGGLTAAAVTPGSV